MVTTFRNALVRPPAASFARGLTTRDLGPPDLARALEQHERYCAALERCGLSVAHLQADPAFPDSTFVEDTAVLSARLAVITRPGAPSRQGEVPAIRDALARFFSAFATIEPPGTVDGGDVCRAGERFFIGVSERTNMEGARQLAGLLAREGHAPTLVDIRGVAGLLHLKSGIAHLGDGRLLLAEALAGRTEFADRRAIRVPMAESLAANCVRVNGHLLFARGYPETERTLRDLGYSLVILDMSEFEKMDGGLSCLSLRF